MNKRAVRRSVRKALRSFAVFLCGSALCTALLLVVNAREAAHGIKALLLSGFDPREGLQKTLLYWPLLILAGLSFGLSWKAGFVNAGIPGQFTIGALLAMTAALLFALPWWVCLAAAALGGALWGALAGVMKPRFLLKEVLSGVMLNFIALYLTQWLWEEALSGRGDNASLYRSGVPVLWTGGNFSVHFGIPVALVLCTALWAALRYTVFGYEIRAGGFSREEALRAGIRADRNLSLAVALSGGLSGLSGGICLLTGMTDVPLSVISNQMGYLGMLAAGLSFFHPLGTVFTALASGAVLSGSEGLPSAFPQEAGQILFGLTLLGAAVLRRNQKVKLGGNGQ